MLVGNRQCKKTEEDIDRNEFIKSRERRGIAKHIWKRNILWIITTLKKNNGKILYESLLGTDIKRNIYIYDRKTYTI